MHASHQRRPHRGVTALLAVVVEELEARVASWYLIGASAIMPRGAGARTRHHRWKSSGRWPILHCCPRTGLPPPSSSRCSSSPRRWWRRTSPGERPPGQVGPPRPQQRGDPTPPRTMVGRTQPTVLTVHGLCCDLRGLVYQGPRSSSVGPGWGGSMTNNRTRTT